MKTKNMLFGALTLCIGLGLFTACGNSNNKPETPETDTKLVMTAPQVEPNEEGFILLDMCPQTDPHLTVKFNDDVTVATIYYDGKEIQTVEYDFAMAPEDAQLHFFDANFDGMTDIYIGPGLSRTPNGLLVWDEFEQQFQIVEGSSLQNPILQPSTESFIDGGSSSYCEIDITLNQWNGDIIIADEFFSVVLDPEQYGELGVEHRFTMTDENGNVMYSTDNIEELPEMWQNILKIHGI